LAGDDRGAAQARPVTTAKGVADQRLSRKREPVEREGGDAQELHQHLIGSQWHVPKARGKEQKAEHDGLQQHRPDQNVAVDDRHVHQPQPVEDAGPRPPCRRRKGIAAQPESQRQTGPFGDEGRPCDACDAPVESQHENQVKHDIRAIHQDLNGQHRAGAFLRDQPAGHAVKPDGRGRRPYPDLHVVPRKAFNLRAGGRDSEGKREQERLQEDDRGACGKADHQGTGQKGRDLVVLPRACRLTDKPGCPHPQKTEDPVKRRQDHGTDSDSTDGRGKTDLPHDAGIDCAQYRHRGVRDHDRDRDVQNAPVGQRQRCRTAIRITHAMSPHHLARNIPAGVRRTGGWPPCRARFQPSRAGIRKCAVAWANIRSRLSCHASTWTEA